MKDRNKDQRAPGQAPDIRDKSAEHLDEKTEGLSEEDERACIPEPDEDSDFEDRDEDRNDDIDEDEEFDEEDWDDAWDEDDYRDRQDRDSGMRRHRMRRRDSDDPL